VTDVPVAIRLEDRQQVAALHALGTCVGGMAVIGGPLGTATEVDPVAPGKVGL
jgi:hypothetical protein